MLTIFTIPKPFRGHIGIIQRNAIQSWLKLRPDCEIILFGNEEGMAEVAAELGVRHVPNIRTNEYGTPFLDGVFESAQQIANNDLVCYVNADIILMNDFISAIQRLETVWDFGGDEWEEHLRNFVNIHGVLHPPFGSDYFVFPKGALGTLPPFVVGRPGWDNWMIYRARKFNILVIDVSPVVTVIHQNHDYGHVSDGTGKTYEGPEANQNINLIDTLDDTTLHDANFVLTSQGLRRPKLIQKYIYRFRTKVLYPQLRLIAMLRNAILRRL